MFSPILSKVCRGCILDDVDAMSSMSDKFCAFVAKALALVLAELSSLCTVLERFGAVAVAAEDEVGGSANIDEADVDAC